MVLAPIHGKSNITIHGNAKRVIEKIDVIVMRYFFEIKDSTIESEGYDVISREN